MSGICGLYEPGREFNTRSVEPMLTALAMPGEHGTQPLAFRSAALGVAQRWDFQQVCEHDGIAVAVDADLLDLPELAKSLSLSASASAEIGVAGMIARLYCLQGADCLRSIRGAFSIALWDSKAQQLLVAIDRIGIRSLYWRKEGSRITFGSRIGAIRAVQMSPVEIDPNAILQFLLFSAIPAPLSSDIGTRKLRPGMFLSIKHGEVSEQQYWDLEYPESTDTSVQRWANELRDGMRSAVHRHLEGTDPQATGCYLSGGTDSSSVTAFTAEKSTFARSFSIAFEETGFSEIEYARTTAAAFHLDHNEKFLVPEDAPEAVDKIVAYYEEPFANSSAIGSYYCAALAKEKGVDTLLAGDGGDELFGGNERYAFDKRFALYHSIPKWIRCGLIEPFTSVLPEGDGKLSLPKKYVRRANIPNPLRMLSYGFFLSMSARDIFEDAFVEQVGDSPTWLGIPEEHFHRARAKSELNRILYMDVKMTLADNDLRKVSGTAELAGVNVRYPLLDDQLAELSGRIPASLKLKGFEKRFIFKQAMKDILPQKVLYKKKHGFGVPLARWLLGDKRMRQLLDDLIHDSKTRQRGYFRRGFVERLSKLHQQQPNFYGEIMWYLVALELWHRKHVDTTRETVDAC